MKKIFFLVNKKDDFTSEKHLEKHLKNFEISIEETLPQNIDNYDLIILWNYRRILKNISNRKNIIIFHSSDLPQGKGWAPIFNSLNENKKLYTISGILPADEVDSGDIVCQAKFEIKDNYTAEYIREFDNEISIMMSKQICEKFDKNILHGKKQTGSESYYPLRRPEDNEIKPNSVIAEIFNFLRACEKTHPAYFFFNKTKYILSLTPEKKPDFPSDLEITFFNDE